MAQRRPRPTRHYRAQVPPANGYMWDANRVHTPVQRMQEASVESAPDPLSAQSESAQLSECHHAVLAHREHRDVLTNRRWVISVSVCGTRMTHLAKVTPKP